LGEHILGESISNFFYYYFLGDGPIKMTCCTPKEGKKKLVKHPQLMNSNMNTLQEYGDTIENN
jgi:hypothetical protein